LECRLEGKDIRIKLGTSRKEHQAAGIKKVKKLNETFLKDSRSARQSALQTVKKLEKIISKDEVKLLEDEIEKNLKKTEDEAKKLCEAKEKEINA